MHESTRIVLVCKRTLNQCLFFTSRLKFRERDLVRLSTNIVELANEGHGEHRDLREAGDGSHWGREEVKLYLGRIGGAVVARGRAACKAGRSCAVRFFVLTGARCSIQAV